MFNNQLLEEENNGLILKARIEMTFAGTDLKNILSTFKGNCHE